MPFDLGRCDAAALHRMGTAARGAGGGHATLESAARALARCFHDELRADDADATARGCALACCYKTHPYGSLPPRLQRAARALLAPGVTPTPGMRCAVLLASASDETPWLERLAAGRHAAIPLPTADAVAAWPLVARLAADFGLAPADLVEPPPDVVRRRRGRRFGVFHVPDAREGALVPAQAELAARAGVRSVVAFGGSLSSGDLFAILLFCREPVSADVAAQFRGLALHAKHALFGFGDTDTFDPTPDPGDGAPCEAEAC